MIDFLHIIIDNIEFCVALCGGIVALLQWKESNNNKRAEYLNSLLSKLWENKDIQQFILLNDYDKNWYTPSFHRSKDKTLPTQADKTLSFMNYICYVLNVRIIHTKERNLFDYYLSSLALCKDMRHYLFDLYQYSILNNKPFLFKYFLNLCIKLRLLPKSFKNKNYFKYIMIEESYKNKKIPYTLPPSIAILNSEFNSNLFLKTISRCEYCKQYKDKKCSCGQKILDYFWLPLQQNNHCKFFDFEEKNWHNPRNFTK